MNFVERNEAWSEAFSLTSLTMTLKLDLAMHTIMRTLLIDQQRSKPRASQHSPQPKPFFFNSIPSDLMED